MDQVTLKNTGAKAIKTLDWDFAFPRYEKDKLVLRCDVSTDIGDQAWRKENSQTATPARRQSAAR